MTLLISCLNVDEIAVAMDTHAMGAAVDVPQLKFWAHPSGAYIVAGTGLADVVEPWLRSVAEAAADSAEVVIAGAPPTLRERWQEVTYDLAKQQTSTMALHTTGYVYFFNGRAPMRQSFSSRHGFAAREYTKCGMSWVPETPMPPQSIIGKIDDSAGGMMLLARHVTSECDRDPSSKVHIDGELYVARLTPDGLVEHRSLGQIRTQSRVHLG